MSTPDIVLLRTQEAVDLYNDLVNNPPIISPGTPTVLVRQTLENHARGAAEIAWKLDLDLTAQGKGTRREMRGARPKKKPYTLPVGVDQYLDLKRKYKDRGEQIKMLLEFIEEKNMGDPFKPKERKGT